ncbi:ATP-binding protein [Flammeovirga sp. SubArs3]|uniref:ATP-binding protein n=1 Tax=Flammeovirga sp. SubArs3 TaxID=2995316 RepID=UPI00248B7482|nr:ATP-binding protein [Flammeovirga sp. SubArs3]
MQTITVEQIKSIPTFTNVPDDQLQWMIDNGTLKKFTNKEKLFEPGSKAEFMFIVLEGEFRVYQLNEKETKFLDTVGKNTVSGVLPFSRIQQYSSLCYSCGDSYCFLLPKEKIGDMIRKHYELTECLVHSMTTRVREFTKQASQNEKLMALGKMSAGLAHELNNPASAMARSGKELKRHLSSVPQKFKAIMKMSVDDESIDFVNELIHSKLKADLLPLSTLEKSNLEDDLLDFLEEKNVNDADEIVEALVEYQFDEDELEEMFDVTGEKNFAPTIIWVASQLVTEKMVNDIKDSSDRISSLITSIKSFSYMDRGQDMTTTDIHEGIQSTLKLLEHKIQKQGHQLDLKLDVNLPPIKGMPGQLNQVWMNILANGIDALEEKKGVITIVTSFDIENVKIELIDNGSGIPEDVQNRIFEPFFTTKGVGKGTGLGLDITKKIIDRHQGKIKVSSTPGHTNFTIILPIDNKI